MESGDETTCGYGIASTCGVLTTMHIVVMMVFPAPVGLLLGPSEARGCRTSPLPSPRHSCHAEQSVLAESKPPYEDNQHKHVNPVEKQMCSLIPRPLPDFIPIFLHSCAIKSGSGLGTRLTNVYVIISHKCYNHVCNSWMKKKKHT